MRGQDCYFEKDVFSLILLKTFRNHLKLGRQIRLVPYNLLEGGLILPLHFGKLSSVSCEHF